jgi:hypothetical protein
MIDETNLAKFTLGGLIAAAVFCGGVAAYRSVVPPAPPPPPTQETPAAQPLKDIKWTPHQK